MTLAPGTRIGKYTVERKLGEGGMAEIYLCSVRGPENFAKKVALKCIRPERAADPKYIEMFITEAKVASHLDHANIVQVSDFDQHEDTYYLAMEYVRGAALSTIQRYAKELSRPMSPPLVAYIGASIARGLHYVHEKRDDEGNSLRLVHRDVTPQNILLSYAGEVKLTDFGIAKNAIRSTTGGTLKGKYAYMSPEQADGDPIDALTDIFALGIVLWELLSGMTLFVAENDLATLRAVREQSIPRLRLLNPLVPPALDDAIFKALQRERSDRHETAQHFMRALSESIYPKADDSDLAQYLKAVVPTSELMPSTDSLEASLERIAHKPPAPAEEKPRASEPAPTSEPAPSSPAETKIARVRGASGEHKASRDKTIIEEPVFPTVVEAPAPATADESLESALSVLREGDSLPTPLPKKVTPYPASRRSSPSGVHSSVGVIQPLARVNARQSAGVPKGVVLAIAAVALMAGAVGVLFFKSKTSYGLPSIHDAGAPPPPPAPDAGVPPSPTSTPTPQCASIDHIRAVPVLIPKYYSEIERVRYTYGKRKTRALDISRLPVCLPVVDIKITYTCKGKKSSHPKPIRYSKSYLETTTTPKIILDCR